MILKSHLIIFLENQKNKRLKILKISQLVIIRKKTFQYFQKLNNKNQIFEKLIRIFKIEHKKAAKLEIK